jgi:hypothetical protein
MRPEQPNHVRKPGGTELLDDFAEKLRCGRKIEQVTPRRALLLIDGRQLLLELSVKIGIAEVEHDSRF